MFKGTPTCPTHCTTMGHNAHLLHVLLPERRS